RREALRFLADLLGLAQLTPQQRAADNARSKARVQRAQKQSLEELAEKQRRAFDLWCKAVPIGGGAGELARRCLGARGIELEALPKGPRGGDRTPGVLRFFATHTHTESGRTPPCLVAGCWHPTTARVLAIHRTWLAADGRGKSDVEPN